jgi:hypothetical protein
MTKRRKRNRKNRLPRGYLTQDQMAARLNKTVRCLQNWRKRGYGPAFTYVGSIPAYAEGSDLEFLAAGERIGD